MKYTAQQYFEKLMQATGETLLMVLMSTLFACVIGLFVGIAATVTSENGIRPNRPINAILEVIINIGRSIPFAIMLVLVIPLTRFFVGTTVGSWKVAVVPLTIATIPFVARVTDSALKEIDGGVIECAQAMGSNGWQIVFKVMLPESLPALLRGMCLTIINLIGYSAMAGTVGGGGLGQLAYNDGFYSYDFMTIFLSVVMIVAIVQLIQWVFNLIVNKIDKKNR